MNTSEAIQTRRSVRSYQEREIPKEILQAIFNDALMAPSWKNTQTAGYLAVCSPEGRAQVLSALPSYNVRSAEHASVLVVMTAIHGRSGFERDGSYSTPAGDRWEYFDAGIACQTLCLAAWERGISTCIMGLFDEAKLRELLQVPETHRITAVIPMGYAVDAPAAPKRKSLEERVTFL